MLSPFYKALLPITSTARLLAAAASLTFSLSALSASYVITDLGSLGLSSRATAINARGEVVGNWTATGDLLNRGFLYSSGVMTDLGSLPGGGTFAYSINDKGQVVGSSGRIAGTVPHAFLYSNRSMVDLGTHWGVRSTATGINNQSQVVGFYSDAYSKEQSRHAFFYSDGNFTDLGSSNWASAINDAGQITLNADANTAGEGRRAFVYSGGALIDLGSLGYDTTGSAINAHGQVVGCSGQRAFLYSGGTMTDLGTIAEYEQNGPFRSSYCASGINASGQIIGSTQITLGFNNWTSKHWLYSGGIMHALYKLVDPDSGWNITEVAGINDAGQIAATGCGRPGCHALLLTPVTTTVVEYQNIEDFPGSPGGHFFYTENVAEQASVDSGISGRFVRTGRTFKASGTKPLCRFYGSPVPGPNSHFFTILDSECDRLKGLQKVPRPLDVPQWNYEGLSFSAVPAQVSAAGESCTAGTIPVYRAYNNAYPSSGPKNTWDSAHRFSTNWKDIEQMVTSFGWRDEGIAFCSIR